MAFSSTPSLVRTRMDTGTARTTWETRGTHTLRLSRKRCCMSTCPHCCGLITPSRCLGSDLRNPGPHMSSALPHHATKVPSPQTDTNAHVHHAHRRARKGTRAQQGQKGLHMASRHAPHHAFCLRLARATAPTTALQPHWKPNRYATLPRNDSKSEDVGRAPAAERPIMVVSGRGSVNRSHFSMAASFAGCG